MVSKPSKTIIRTMGAPGKGYYIYRHQGKEIPFGEALCNAGYWNTGDISKARIVLMDVDTAGRVAHFQKDKTKLFVYPHAARPFVGWDGLFTSSQHTSAAFVFAEGHIDVIRAYGYKKPLHPVGWAYSEIKPFVPASDPKKILFAPIHPNRNGWLSAMDKNINKRTYKILLDMIDTHDMSLTVRLIRGLDANGLWKDNRVCYVEGQTNTKQMDDLARADIGVSHQTYAWIGVALGRPMVMMGEGEAPRNGGSEADFKQVKSWDLYRHLLAFPLDILNTEDPYGLLVQACESDECIRDWKSRMIGSETFDPKKFISAMEMYL